MTRVYYRRKDENTLVHEYVHNDGTIVSYIIGQIVLTHNEIKIGNVWMSICVY